MDCLNMPCPSAYPDYLPGVSKVLGHCDNIDVFFKDKLRYRLQKALEAKREDAALYIENPYR